MRGGEILVLFWLGDYGVMRGYTIYGSVGFRLAGMLIRGIFSFAMHTLLAY